MSNSALFEVYLENRGETNGKECSKFYHVECSEKGTIFRWGRTEQFESIRKKVDGGGVKIASPVACQATALKQIETKANKGYREIWRNIGGRVKAKEAEVEKSGRRFGLEIETHTRIDVDTILERLRKRGINVNDDRHAYFHSDGTKWDLKRDGSCGYEFASSILHGESGIFDCKVAVENVQQVCSGKSAVNDECGLHVTVDISDLKDIDLKRLVYHYLRAQEHFYAMCNKTRQSNRYCARNPLRYLNYLSVNNAALSVPDFMDRCGGWSDRNNRYLGLNLTRMFSKKVIEFRMKESTVAPREVGKWIRTCLNFVDNVKLLKPGFDNVSLMTSAEFERYV